MKTINETPATENGISALQAEIRALEEKIRKAEQAALYGTKVAVAPGNYTEEETAQIRRQNQELKAQALVAVNESLNPAKVRLAGLRAKLAVA